MPAAGDNERIAAEIQALLEEAVQRLRSAGARTEALAEYVPEHRVLLVPRPAVLRSKGRIWRLGVFLLGEDATLYETGQATRALEPGRPGYQSQSAERRRAYRAAASRGRFPHGETVNFDAVPVTLDVDELRNSIGRLFVEGDRPRVRWNANTSDADAVDLASYLADRVELLAEPPAGA
ncbi:MAG TPA: hypothetical protein VGO88_05620 [Mycetocola sp.]|jgi:hypothetical protein|uniref:hypothetical protein n=1 Tax=Mycetocola sp. TaxID=1871042 RepID=UPI002626F8E0|nr:hypothetical protein [Mycetocola sp.]MCU1419438.1 hypothetical protein [Mycetocola sp.]MCU1561419.1 hypothetical protein [Mycetocola sp.]HEV7848788.1 hypothetical protein [Mycetocola sp.]